MDLINLLKRKFLPVSLSLGLIFNSWGCVKYFHKCESMHEHAKVISKFYLPNEFIIFPADDGGAIPVTYPESYNLVFEGELDFIVNDFKLYNSFNVGDNVSLEYIECFKEIYFSYAGKNSLINRSFLGNYFVNAEKIPN